MWSFTPTRLSYLVLHHPHKVHKVFIIESVGEKGHESSTGPDSQKVKESVRSEVIYFCC